MRDKTFDQLVNQNINMIKQHQNNRRQGRRDRYTPQQHERKMQRSRQKHEKSLIDQHRRDKMLQQAYDRQTMRGVASGHTDPRAAMAGMGEGGRQALMMGRPEAFGGGAGGAPGGGGAASGGAGGGGGLTLNQLFSASGDHMEAVSDPMFQGLPETDAAGNPLSPEQARAHAARNRLGQQVSMTQAFMPQGQQGPPTMPEARRAGLDEDARDREHFDRTVIESYVDAEGNPVDASRAGEEGVYRKYTHQGRNTGARVVGTPPPGSVGAVGFGEGRREVGRDTAPGSATEQAIEKAFGRTGRGADYQRGRAADVGREDRDAVESRERGGDRASRQDDGGDAVRQAAQRVRGQREQAGHDRQRQSLPDDITLDRIAEIASSEPEKEGPRDHFYGGPRTSTRESIPSRVQRWASRQKPGRGYGQGELEYALEEAGLAPENRREQKNMAARLQKAFPNVPENEIVKRLRELLEGGQQ